MIQSIHKFCWEIMEQKSTKVGKFFCVTRSSSMTCDFEQHERFRLFLQTLENSDVMRQWKFIELEVNSMYKNKFSFQGFIKSGRTCNSNVKFRCINFRIGIKFKFCTKLLANKTYKNPLISCKKIIINSSLRD